MPISLIAETLQIEGPDAIAFAHAQFSSKVNSLGVGQWQFSAWLDPQGRVRTLFQLARVAEDRLLLLLRGGSAAAMAEALQRFVFRSRLALHALPARALASGPALPLHEVQTVDGALTFGCDTHSLRIVDEPSGDDHWRHAQLREGWPWLPADSLGQWLPAALSLQRLQAVAIDKGCYPGQEIVARLHYRGGHKRHLHSVALSQPASAGDALVRDGHELGRLLDVIRTDDGIEALAVLNDDAVARATNGRLDVRDGKLLISLVRAWPA